MECSFCSTRSQSIETTATWSRHGSSRTCRKTTTSGYRSQQTKHATRNRCTPFLIWCIILVEKTSVRCHINMAPMKYTKPTLKPKNTSSSTILTWRHEIPQSSSLSSCTSQSWRSPTTTQISNSRSQPSSTQSRSKRKQAWLSGMEEQLCSFQVLHTHSSAPWQWAISYKSVFFVFQCWNTSKSSAACDSHLF